MTPPAADPDGVARRRRYELAFYAYDEAAANSGVTLRRVVVE